MDIGSFHRQIVLKVYSLANFLWLCCEAALRPPTWSTVYEVAATVSRLRPSVCQYICMCCVLCLIFLRSRDWKYELRATVLHSWVTYW